MRATWILLLLAALAAPGAAQPLSGEPPRVPLRFDHLYPYEALTEALHQLAQAYPELLQVQSIGKSTEGRDLWLATLQNPETGPEGGKAAIWIDGNVHGNEAQGAVVCLYTLWYLLENHDTVQAIGRIVDERVVYVLPTQNPDGLAWWFAGPNTTHSSRSGKAPLDSDRDGLFDEDGPEDIDGDGEILRMRRRSPEGRWKVSPEDPRLMVRAEPDEPGEYEMLGQEGIDNDEDGRVNEDGPGGYDLNRNWPADWQPDHIQRGAGDYPLSYPEPRAIATFLLDHPNIAAVQSYHNAGGMILRGPGSRSVGEYPREDVRVFDALGRKGEETLPFYRYMVIWKDLYTVRGGFVTWTFEDLGIFSFTNELWSPKQYFQRADDPEEGWYGADEGRLVFDDLLEFGYQYVEWKAFHHPTYGDIELGGWRRETGRVPPGWMIQEMCHRNFAFTMYHADQMPQVRLRDVEVEALADGGHLITATAQNPKLIPTRSGQARRQKIGRPDLFTLEGEGLTVVSGGFLQDRDRERMEAVEHRPARLARPGGLGSWESVTARWLVTGSGPARVRYSSEKGGTVEMELTLP